MSNLRLERTFKADPETVFAFITQPEHLLKWWGPEGMTIPEYDLNFTQKGPWSTVFVGSQGQRHKVTGEVLEVDPPSFVELTWGWHDDDDQRGHSSTVRLEVASNGNGGTSFALIHTGLPSEETAQHHNQGWSSSLVKLERIANN